MGRRQRQMFGVALTDFMRNNCHYIAAGIAYWTLFSLFPLALAGIAILGYVYATLQEHDRIVEGIIELIPVSEEYLAELIRQVTRARGALGVLAILGLTWTGTSVFSAVRKGINHAWHVRRPPYFLLERAIDLLMLFGVAVLALVHVYLTTNLLGISSLIDGITNRAVLVLIRAIFEIIALSITVGAFILLFRFVPHTRVEWQDIWLGAVMGATLFHVVRLGFALFISSFGSLNLVYGSLGAIMAVLLWAYLALMAIMWRAQVSYTYSCVFGSQAGTIVLPERQPSFGESPTHGGTRRIISTLIGWLLPPKRERP